ncbi:hypothetical protein HYS42_01580 [Candidatus Saccharibacteria bacterium]|nr:hypothetical protein [Candidatus Saccharibacteria bacterium]
MFKVFVAHPIPKSGLQMLAGLQVDLNDQSGPLAKTDLINRAKPSCPKRSSAFAASQLSSASIGKNQKTPP